jgi:hypothetical protein
VKDITTTTIATALYQATTDVSTMKWNSDFKCPQNAWTSGFRKAGIYPFNRDAVKADAFTTGAIHAAAAEEAAGIKALMSLATPPPPTRTPKLSPPPVPPTADAVAAAVAKALPTPQLSVEARLAEAKKKQDELRASRKKEASVITDDPYLVPLLMQVSEKYRLAKEKEAAAAAAKLHKEAAKSLAAERQALGLPAKPVYKLEFTLESDYTGRIQGATMLTARVDDARLDFTVFGPRKRAARKPAAAAAAASHSSPSASE